MSNDSDMGAEVAGVVREWRAKAMSVVLWVLAVSALPTVIAGVGYDQFGAPWVVRGVGAASFLMLVAAAWCRAWSLERRAVLFFIAAYAVSAIQFGLTGLLGSGRIGLLLVPLLALILVGNRAGYIALGLSTLMFGVAAGLAAGGVLSRGLVIRENSTAPGFWLFQGAMWLAALIPLMVLLTQFLSLQMRTLLAERQARRAQDDFARQLIDAQEKERRRIAGELHDGLGQDLLVIANKAQFGLAKTGDLPGTAARLQEIAETAKHAVQQARRMAYDLRPGLLEELGFTEAVEACAEKAGQSSEMSVKLELANVDGLLAPEFEANLFRILQEALNNILKHAGATEAKVTLALAESALRLVVEDNGRGFEPEVGLRTGWSQKGLGLQQMSERAGMMGGRVDLQSRPGQGTRLVVEVPVKNSW